LDQRHLVVNELYTEASACLRLAENSQAWRDDLFSDLPSAPNTDDGLQDEEEQKKIKKKKKTTTFASWRLNLRMEKRR